MKRVLVSLVVAVGLALPVSAQTLPQQVQSEASRLLVQVNAAQAAALSRLSHVLKDAAEIARAVGGGAAAQTKAAAKLSSAAATKCTASRDF